MNKSLKKQPFRMDRFLTLFFFRPLLGFTSAPKNFGIPILMYHRISEDEEVGVHPYYKLCTPPSRFREHMQFIKDNGYRVVSLKEAADLVSNESSYLPPPHKYLVLTFDDGYEDFYTTAWPILKEFGYPATLFLPTGLLRDGLEVTPRNEPDTAYLSRFALRHYSNTRGRSVTSAPSLSGSSLQPGRYEPSQANPTRSPFLSWAQVKELSNHGVTLGSHSVNHVQLYHLKDWSDIRLELLNSKKDIEQNVGVTVSIFSYPYAYPQTDKAFCRRFSMTLAECGYELCVTTCVGFLTRKDSLLSIKRIPVNGNDDVTFFEAKLSGFYNWIGFFQYIWKLYKEKFRDGIHANVRYNFSCQK